MPGEYLFILIAFFLSALFLEWRFKIHLYRTRKERWAITLVFFVVGIVWDMFAVWQRHWVFTGIGLVGVKIGILPLEEYIFSLVVPFWTITVYKILERKFK